MNRYRRNWNTLYKNLVVIAGEFQKCKSAREDPLEEYAIKFCFKLGKMLQKRMEFFRLLLYHLA